jgi:hypothetical protein
LHITVSYMRRDQLLLGMTVIYFLILQIIKFVKNIIHLKRQKRGTRSAYT